MAGYVLDIGKLEYLVENKQVGSASIHTHSYYEIEFFTSGSGVQNINGVKSELKKGVIIFCTPMVDFHSIRAFGKPFDIMNISFSNHMFSSEMLNLIKEYKPPFVIRLDGNEYDKMISAFEELFNEQNTKDSFHERSVKYKISNICISIIRKAMSERKKQKEEIPQITENKISMDLINEIIPYLNDNFQKKISRDDAAKILHINSSYFSIAFKKYLGIAFSDYLIDLRMDFAMRMLKYSDQSISAIIESIGYNSTSAFYKQFKKTFGILPGDVERMKNKYI